SGTPKRAAISRPRSSAGSAMATTRAAGCSRKPLRWVAATAPAPISAMLTCVVWDMEKSGASPRAQTFKRAAHRRQRRAVVLLHFEHLPFERADCGGGGEDGRKIHRAFPNPRVVA